MKKIFFYLTLLLIIIPFNVSASSISINCDKKEVNPGEEISCSLDSVMDEGVTYNKLEANVDVEGSSSINFSGEAGFNGTIENNILTITSDRLVNNVKLGTLKVKFSSNGSIKLNNIKVYSENNESSTIENVETSIKVKEENIILESLSVSDCNYCKLSPSFKSNITFYMVSTNSDQIRINANGGPNYTVSGTGLKKLTKESETFEINVSSSGGNVKTYKILVTKEPKGDATLKSLSIDKGTLNPSFSSSTTSYNATVDSDKVVISATKNNDKATIEGTGEKELKYGKNTFTIVVTAEDGTTKSYLININRPDTRNANAYLKELTINGEDIEFEKDIIDYDYTVAGDVTELEIEATPELESSTVEITGNENFKVGENIVTIKVTAEDGSEKIYTITVTKDEMIEEVVSGIYLEKLEISGYKIDFDKEKFEYTITIKDEKKLDINALSSDEYKVEVIGNDNLQDGSIIKIIVTDENNNSNIYKIKIKVEKVNNDEKKSNDMNYIPIIMISLLVILFVVDVMLVIKKVKDKDK